MVGNLDIAEPDQAYNRNFLLSCGLVTTLLALGLAGLVAFALISDRQAARYPGATPITSHSNYSRLPFSYLWYDAYHTNDSFTRVYNWYSVGLDLGAETMAFGSCITLQRSQKHLATERLTSAHLCDTLNGRLIFVTRWTSLKF